MLAHTGIIRRPTVSLPSALSASLIYTCSSHLGTPILESPKYYFDITKIYEGI